MLPKEPEPLGNWGSAAATTELDPLRPTLSNKKVQYIIWAFTIGVTLVAAVVDFRTPQDTQLAYRAGIFPWARCAFCYRVGREPRL